jgi:hypothetical protein
MIMFITVFVLADHKSEAWADKQIADAFDCTTKTVENIRQRYCEFGFDVALNGKQRQSPPGERKFDGDAEAKVIALRLRSLPRATPIGRWIFCRSESLPFQLWTAIAERHCAKR